MLLTRHAMFKIRPILALLLLVPASVMGDDDPTPPVDPGAGFEGILGSPSLSQGYVIDQGTVPWGVQSVFNAPQLRMGQSFTPTQATMDWVGFVFQNTYQPSWPNPAGPGFMRISVFSGLQLSTGILTGLLGVSETVEVAQPEQGWKILDFADPVNLVPGQQHYLLVEHVGGYPTWVGGRSNNVYSGGSAFGYLLNPFNGQYQRLTEFSGYDLIFVQGSVIQPVPEPRSLLLGSLGAIAAAASVFARTGPSTWFRTRIRVGSLDRMA